MGEKEIVLWFSKAPSRIWSWVRDFIFYDDIFMLNLPSPGIASNLGTGFVQSFKIWYEFLLGNHMDTFSLSVPILIFLSPFDGTLCLHRTEESKFLFVTNTGVSMYRTLHYLWVCSYLSNRVPPCLTHFTWMVLEYGQ